MPLPVEGLKLEEVAPVRRFRVADLPDRTWLGGRVTIHRHPRPNRLYVAGSDFALGLEGRDKDTTCILDWTAWSETGVAEQVAELEGSWGDEVDRVLFAALRYYASPQVGFTAFLVGERQIGLSVLRRLYRDCGVRFMYYNRQEESRSRRRQNTLGVHKNNRLLLLRNLRKSFASGEVKFHSVRLLEQMKRVQFRATPAEERTSERDADDDLKVKVQGGGSPDLVMAAAYAVHGLREVAHFMEEAKQWPPGSYGAVLGLDDDLLEEDEEEDAGGATITRL